MCVNSPRSIFAMVSLTTCCVQYLRVPLWCCGGRLGRYRFLNVLGHTPNAFAKSFKFTHFIIFSLRLHHLLILLLLVFDTQCNVFFAFAFFYSLGGCGSGCQYFASSIDCTNDINPKTLSSKLSVSTHK